MLSVTLNDVVALRVVAFDGATGLFPQVKVYNAAGSLVTTLNPAHVAGGMYSVNWTATPAGLFTAVGTFYTDAGHTTPATTYGLTSEDLDVNTLKPDVARLLGLVQENAVIDLQVYDLAGNLSSARIRAYDSKAHALAAGATGLVATYSMAATYSGVQLTNYSVVKEP